MAILRGTCIKWITDEGAIIKRLVALDTFAGAAVLIDVDYTYASLETHLYVDIETSLANNVAEVCPEPWNEILLPDACFFESQIATRDKDWHDYQELVEHPDILNFKLRTALILEWANKLGCSENTVRNKDRRFWQRGMIPNAYIPDPHKNRGAPGQIREPGDVRRGRPRTILEDGPGINVDAKVRDGLQKGYRKHFVKLKKKLAVAYKDTLDDFFYVGPKSNRKPMDNPPSQAQFEYWGPKGLDRVEVIEIRAGESGFSNNIAATPGTMQDLTIGAMHLLQIDFSGGGVQLVSSIDHFTPIGPATLCGLSDTDSSKIVGLHPSLDTAAWKAVIPALYYVFTGMASFFRLHGIEVDDDDYPPGVPRGMLADNGEMEGYQADNLPNQFGTKVVQTRPYGASKKGGIESVWGMFQAELENNDVPGKTDKHWKRGRGNPLTDPVLTLHEYTQIILKLADHYNRSVPMPISYLRRRGAVKAEVRPFRLDYHEWSLAHRTGLLDRPQPQATYLNLLPTDKASIFGSTIHFKKIEFVCQTGLNNGWFLREDQQTIDSVDIVYHPTWAIVYARLADGTLERCQLHSKWRIFEGCSWLEVDAELDRRNRVRAQEGRKTRQDRANSKAFVAGVIDNAKATRDAALREHEEQFGPVSKKSRTQGTRENRQAEIAAGGSKAPLEPEESLKQQETEKEADNERPASPFSPPDDFELLSHLHKEG